MPYFYDYGTYTSSSTKSESNSELNKGFKHREQRLNNASQINSSDAEEEEKADLSKLIMLAKPESSLIGLALGAQAVSAGATILFPMALGRIVDSMSGGVTGNLDNLMVGLGGVFAAASVATGLRVSALSLAGFRIERNLRKRFFTAILRQETGFFDQRQSGELVNRLSSDVAVVSKTLTTNITKLMRAAITGIGASSMIIYTSPKLALVALAASPPIFILARIFGRYAKVLSRQLADSLAFATEIASERIGSIKTVRILGAERIEAERYASRIDESYSLARKTALIDGAYSGSLFCVAQLSLLSVLWLGKKLVADPSNHMTIGGLASFIMYSAQLGGSLSATGTAYGQLSRAQGAAFRILEVMNRAPKEDSSTIYYSNTNEEGILDNADRKTNAWSKSGNVEFENVVFEYPTNPNTPVLRGTSFSILPGKVTAIAGSSGSGKSTIGSLLTGMYRKTSGSILLGGQNIEDIDTFTLRKHVSIVPQDPTLFNGTVAENIIYGSRENAKIEDIIATAKYAESHEMISNLPLGYETIVGERGQGLSGGQRARIALCRALFREPSLLILDEHSAALDAESERAIAATIQRTARKLNIPVLAIAHRPSTLRMADNLLFIEDGIIVEQGRFESLLEKQDGKLRKQFIP